MVEDGGHVLPEVQRYKMKAVVMMLKAIMQMMTMTLSKPLQSLGRGSARRTPVSWQRWSNLGHIQPRFDLDLWCQMNSSWWSHFDLVRLNLWI